MGIGGSGGSEVAAEGSVECGGFEGREVKRLRPGSEASIAILSIYG